MRADTLKYRKNKGVLKLPLKKGWRQFVDKDPFDETKEEYTYLGQIDFLHVYVLGGLYWETLDYKFISKMNGAELESFIGFPYVSPQKNTSLVFLEIRIAMKQDLVYIV